MLNILPASVTTGRGRESVMPRRAREEALRRRFPTLSRSQANKIARRNLLLSVAIDEAMLHLRGFKNGVPMSAFKGFDPTGETAVDALVNGGMR